MLPRNIVQVNRPKTPRVHALGVFVWLLCGWIGGVTAGCPPLRIDETARVADVLDGDTLRLHDGRRVRVLGVNAPELAHERQVEQPFGRAAHNAASEFFPRNATIHLVYDYQRRDRYGRLLAHVYNSDKQSLAVMLLAKGLAFQVVVPPNVALTKCLAKLTEPAQASGSGIWGERYWQPRSSKEVREPGFMRIRGKIVKVTEKRDVWLELDGSVVVKIVAGDRHYFAYKDWQSLRGKELQVRGWVIDRASSEQRLKGFKPFQLQLRHPVMLEKLSD